MGSYRYEILRETTTDSLIMENNTREKKMNSNVYGIDLGTCNMKIYCKTSNKILNEKNTIALVKKDQIYAYGDAAYAMYEKAPETINVTFPVISGVIADFNNLSSTFIISKSFLRDFGWEIWNKKSLYIENNIA